jgi:hypothetical protein
MLSNAMLCSKGWKKDDLGRRVSTEHASRYDHQMPSAP